MYHQQADAAVVGFAIVNSFFIPVGNKPDQMSTTTSSAIWLRGHDSRNLLSVC